MPNAKPSATQTTAARSDIDHAAFIDANRVFCYLTNDGTFARDYLGQLNLTGGGLVFPYVGLQNVENGIANKTPLFAAGIWLAALDSITGDTLAALAEFASEFVPGPMSGGAPQPDNPTFRVYKLYRDSLASNPNQDYLNWPISQGAPTDSTGAPELRGDQTLWAVYNDADPAAHTNSASAPLGVEVQQLIWASDPQEYSDSIRLDTIITAQGPVWVGEPPVQAIIKDFSAVTGDSYAVVFVEDTGLGLYWRLLNTTLNTVVLDSQTNVTGDTNYAVVDGMQVIVENRLQPISWEYESANPLNVSPVATADNGYTGDDRWFTGGDHGGVLFFGGVFLEPNFWGVTTLTNEEYSNVEIRFRPMLSFTDLNADGEYTIGEPYVVDDPAQTQKAFMYQTFNGAAYEGFFDIPFTAWDISDTAAPRQLNVVVRDRDANHQWDLHSQVADNSLPNNGDQRFNYTWILGTTYDPAGMMYGDGSGASIDFFGGAGGAVEDAMWTLWLDERGLTRGPLAEECDFRLYLRKSLAPSDTFTFTAPSAGYALMGGDANAFYIKYTLINKGSKYLRDFYVGIWSDPDLGGASDDLVGCDSASNLFYCYNEDNDDA
ncbi:MAG TPA: hypothetical protein VLB27_10245, partial [candidate division Zixibacteria bacterium]|nr:hypothetical protein [candidate division Zixibacteria bacterium]